MVMISSRALVNPHALSREKPEKLQHERESWIAHQEELHRKAKPIMLSPADLDFDPKVS